MFPAPLKASFLVFLSSQVFAYTLTGFLAPLYAH